MQRLFAAGFVLALTSAWILAQSSPEETYISIYHTTLAADGLAASGNDRGALARYTEARAALQALQTAHPAWNRGVVQSRLEDVTAKMEALTRKLGVVPPPAAATNPVPAQPALAPAGDVAADAVRALQAELQQLRERNRLLEAKLKEALSVQPAAVDPAELAKAEQKVRELQKENELLKVTLEQVRQQAAAAPKLEAEPTLPIRPPVGGGANAPLDEKLAGALARLAVLEAQRVPYSAEELALLKTPPPAAAPAGQQTPPPQRKPRDLPAGAGPLLAQADRDLDAGRLAQAEQKYRELLRQDETHLIPLTRLAGLLIDQNKLEEAEKFLETALKTDPDDPGTRYLLGSLRARQERYDEALDHLSRSAAAAPDNAQTQFMLGRVLAQQGQRQPAETALRKAILLKPGWGEAHYALAVVYATHQPPLRELAQWHYKKARAAGVPANAEFEKTIQEVANR